MQGHLDFIAKTLGIERVDASLTGAEVRELEAQVMTYVARVDDL
jgi:hypothetical protein